jgi:hypothetical protein
VRAAALLSILTMAACAASTLPPVQQTSLRLAPGGLDVAGTGREIGFGRAPEGAVAAVTRLLDAQPDSRGRADGCETVRWAGGLELSFRKRGMTGWRALPGALPLRTATGAAPGGPALPVADGIDATLAADGRVATLSAGRVCT